MRRKGGMRLEIPKICRYCGGVVHLVSAAEVYGMAATKRLGIEQEKFYQCQNCNARVGCHKGTTRPLGNHAIVLTERQDRFEQALTCAGLCIAQMHIFADGVKAII